jgi:hypothetical protein
LPERKHFIINAKKDGKSYELHVRRNGNIDPRLAFGAMEAKKLALDKGYQLSAEPTPVKKHFRVAATKDGKPVEIDLHRNGLIVTRTP